MAERRGTMTRNEHRWARRILCALLFGVLAAACGGAGDTTLLPDAEDDGQAAADLRASEVAEDSGLTPEVAADRGGGQDSGDAFVSCWPGEGCFSELCSEGADCLSGFCVNHLGDSVCTDTCVEECPEGWSCKQLAGGPDVTFICVSDFRVLCRPCVTNADCTGTSGQEDACLNYGEGGKFCGALCGAEDACPEDYDCQLVADENGIETSQCVSSSGTCDCSQQSVELGLFTTCSRENDFGVCPGVRVCMEEGLTDCDAPAAAAETCNIVDDDCDGDVDEETCDDDNPCTEDSCGGESGCHHEPLTGVNCDDGDACTVTDHCDDGECTGTVIACDDGDPCTDDLCDGVFGCTFEENYAECDDGDPCTVGDACSEGVCAGTAVSCECSTNDDCAQYDDDNLCTGTLFCDEDVVPHQCKLVPDSMIECPPPEGGDALCLKAWCEPVTGECSHVPANDGFACSDNDACTYGEVCAGGECLGGVQANCNDGNDCTEDACSQATGCTYVNVAGPCNDGNACTHPDLCAEGACVPGPDISCDDNNPCTADSCNPATGCSQVPLGGACDDGNACTAGDHCEGGFCLPTGLTECDDSNLCTDDVCHPESGCLYEFNSAPCTDSNQCTTGDACAQGACVAGQPLECDDGNACTDDACNPLVGCTHVNNADACDDFDPCTENDACFGGLCVGAAPKECGDDNPCTDDICIPMAGCSHVNNQNPCSDEDVCTIADLCSGGVCVPGEETACDDSNICTDDSCDPGAGCVFQTNTVPCDDLNSCTIDDQCSGGQCVGSGSLECDDDNPCTKDICLPGGGCQHKNIAAACSDGNPCTVNDQCGDGQCVAGVELDCDDGNPCTEDACTETGVCGNEPVEAECDDANACTIGDVCVDGWCKAPAILDCNDDDVCTSNYCDPAVGCVSSTNTAPCNDENSCTIDDLCQEGLCVGEVVVCNDNNGCTDDSCNPALGCVFQANILPCDDGNACTTDDVCGGGLCLPGAPLDCHDEDVCTTDSCSPLDACIHSLNTAPCDDGNVCTTADKCDAGLCVGGPELECEDDNTCTDDSCDPESGCTHVDNTEPCDDLNVCTEGDECVGGACVPGPAKDCDDANQCTTDSCDAVDGCLNQALENGTSCSEDDGDPCTSATCEDGECVSTGTGWKHYGGHCYKFFADKKSWGDARTACLGEGADLVSLSNNAENLFTITIVTETFWAGLNDQASEGSWKWTDGTPYSYTNWGGGEPNNSGNEDCVQIYTSASAQWNDLPCSASLTYMCEK